jgi:hypothetical protein
LRFSGLFSSIVAAPPTTSKLTVSSPAIRSRVYASP